MKDDLYVRRFEPSCIVPVTLEVHGETIPDDSCVVRRAAPPDDAARTQMREQSIARMRRDDTHEEPMPPTVWSKEEVIKLWAQAEGELRGFQRVLARQHMGLTAAQLDMALQLANERFAQLAEE